MQSRYVSEASMAMKKQLNQSTEQSLQYWGGSPSYQPVHDCLAMAQGV